MKAQHAILRFAKYKGSTTSWIEAHNEQTKEICVSDLNINMEQSQ